MKTQLCKNRNNITAAVIILQVILAGVAAGQNISWLDINGLRWFSSLQQGYEDKLFAMQYDYTTGYSSVYYSTDKGYSWTEHSFDYNDVTNYSVKGDSVVMQRYIERSSSRNQVFLSTDRGVTFNRILAETYAWREGVTITDLRNIYAISWGDYGSPAINISQYAGGSWNYIGTPVPISARYAGFFIDHTDNFIFYGYSSFGGLVISSDRGATWSRTLEEKNITAVTADPNNNLIAAGVRMSESVPGGLYRTTDGGASWMMLVETGDLVFYSLAADEVGNIYGATNENIVIWRSNGTIEEMVPIDGGFEDIIIMSDGSIMASSYEYGLYHSTDRGAIWIPHSPRAENIYSLGLTSGGTLVVGTLGSGILRSINLGTTWEHASSADFPPYVYSLSQGNNYMLAGTENGVYRSPDDGKTWEECEQSFFSGSVHAVCRTDNGNIFIGTNFGIFKSTNDGSDWSPFGLDGIQVKLLTSVSNMVYAYVPTMGIFRSNDSFSYWDNLSISPTWDEELQCMKVNSAGQLFAGIYGGILVSPRANVWQKVSFTNSYVYSIAINNDQDILAGTYSGVYISRDSGQTWSFAGLPGSTVMSMDFDQEQNLFAGLYRGGVYRSAAAVTAVGDEKEPLPAETALHQNYPNPFNPETKISYSITAKQHVSLKIFNCLGQEVASLADERKEPGSYELTWDGGGYPSGIYFTQMRVDGRILKNIKMLLIK